jgi:hypothetical protein
MLPTPDSNYTNTDGERLAILGYYPGSVESCKKKSPVFSAQADPGPENQDLRIGALPTCG